MLVWSCIVVALSALDLAADSPACVDVSCCLFGLLVALVVACWCRWSCGAGQCCSALLLLLLLLGPLWRCLAELGLRCVPLARLPLAAIRLRLRSGCRCSVFDAQYLPSVVA